MKQLMALFMLLFAVGLVLPASVLADNETNSTDEDEIEDIVSSINGAQMRMLQLHHQLELKVLQANTIIARLETSTNASANGSVNITDEELDTLKDIAADLAALSDEVEAAANSSNANEVTVEAFLAFKAEGKELVQAFRAALKSTLSEGDKRELRQRFTESEREDFAELRERIEEKRQALNAERVRGILTALGVDLEDLAAKIESGEIDVAEVKARLAAHIRALDEAKKREAAERLTERETKLRIARADVVADVDVDVRRLEIRERVDEKREEVREEADKLRIELRERIEERDGLEIRTKTETRTDADVDDDVEAESETSIEAEVTVR